MMRDVIAFDAAVSGLASMNNTPTISVVIPVWNAEAVIAEAVASVQAQTRGDWEILAVDDRSTDQSRAILARLAASDPRIRVLQNTGTKGPGPARNLGISAAQGRFVAFLDADDLWHPKKLARQIAFMESGGHRLSFTAYIRRNMATGVETEIGVPAHVQRKDLLLTNWIACSSAIYDVDFFGFQQMPELRRRQDFAFWLGLLGEADAAGLDEILMIYRQQASSVSSNKGAAAASTWAMYRDHLGLSFPEAAWVFGNYALRGLLRHRAPALARRLGWLHPARRVAND